MADPTTSITAASTASSSTTAVVQRQLEHADDEDAVIAAPEATAASAAAPAQIHETDNDDDEEEEDYEYEFEDEDDAAFSGFLETVDDKSSKTNLVVDEEAAATAAPSASEKVASPEKEEKPKWRQPSQEAVNMSLRAEQETTGGKRRLAQDLYRIMNQDHQKAGFSLQPASEDSMKKWTLKLFQFDEDSNLAKDLKVLGLEHVELEMDFPDQYPFEPPFVRVTRPRFKRQTGFVMNGALCMELLTKDGWNPVNDIESVIVSIRSLLVVGDGRLEAAYNLSEKRYQELLESKTEAEPAAKRQKTTGRQGGSYTTSEAEAAYSHLTDYHKKKGWDTSGWWARKG